jgi:hypothetical protein
MGVVQDNCGASRLDKGTVMADDLLRSRITFVETNLRQIGNLMEVVKKRKNHLGDTHAFLSDSATQLQQAVGKLNDTASALRQSAKEDQWLPFRNEHLSVLRDMASELVKMSDSMESHAQALEQSQSLLSRLAQPAPAAGAGGFTAVQLEKTTVDAIETKLKEIRSVLDTPADPAGMQTRTAWKDFSEHVRTQAQDLFSEYVDLLGGLAVRDAGLDQDACRLADDLFRFYAIGSRQAPPLTIPSRYRVNSRGWGQVMRLGFPEWTIWTLPLVAQDFWFAVGRNRFQADLKLADVDVTDSAIQECLADAFGTFALGPAYAYAAIRLRFDPFTAYEAVRSSASDDSRVHAVVSMLTEMGGPPGALNDFKQIASDLSKQWQEALDFAEPRGAADEKFKKAIGNAVATLAAGMRGAVEGQAGLTVEAWNEFRTWPDLLLSGDSAIPGGAGTELRWVLNAAWVARVKGGEHKVPELTERVITLWNNVVGATTGNQRGPKLQALR